MPTRKEFMNYNYKLYNTKGKYDLIMDIAKTLSMEEIQVLEKMLLELWFNKLESKKLENNISYEDKKREYIKDIKKLDKLTQEMKKL